MSEFCDFLLKKSVKLGIDLNDEKLKQFEKYYHMLIETNTVMNLTAITEWREVIDKHFVDSMALVLCKEYIGKNVSVIDVGTGAGFPGIPLKIAFPDWKITCIDSLKKRIDFINRVIDECGLKEIDTVHGRAEDLGRNKMYREKYDIAVSRAVARLEVLSEYCTPFVKHNGYFISYKSGSVEEEQKKAENALRLLNCRVVECKKFVLPGTDKERSFVVIKKEEKTPERYPRKAGTPGKNPL